MIADAAKKISLAAQAVTGAAIWTFSFYWFGESTFCWYVRPPCTPLSFGHSHTTHYRFAGTGGNFWRDDSPLLLKAYVACNVVVAITVCKETLRS